MKKRLLLFLKITLMLFWIGLNGNAQSFIEIGNPVCAEVNEEYPDSNYCDSDLKVQATPGASYVSFIKFDISGQTDEVNSAGLKLYAGHHEDLNAGGGEGNLEVPYNLLLLPSEKNNWDETLSYNQAFTTLELIDPNSSILAEVDIITYGSGDDDNNEKWYRFDNPAITNHVNAMIAAGKDSVSFALVTRDTVGHNIWVGNWSNKVPTLILEKGDAPLTIPSNDWAEGFEHLPDSASPDGGDLGDLKLQTKTDSTMMGMAKFDLSSIPAGMEVSKVAIKLYGSQHEESNPLLDEYLIHVHESNITDWAGDTISWNDFSYENNPAVAYFNLNVSNDANKYEKYRIVEHPLLTEKVNSYIEEGKSSISLVFKAGTESDNINAWIGGSWKKSELLVELGIAPIILESVNDGQVNSDQPTSVNPDDNDNDLKFQSWADSAIVSYVKFDLTSLINLDQDIKSITLHTYGGQQKDEDDGAVDRYLVDLVEINDTAAIDRESLTWNIASPFTPDIYNDTTTVIERVNMYMANDNNKVHKNIYFDQGSLDKWIKAAVNAGQENIAFAFIARDSVSHNAYFGGNTWNTPELIVETGFGKYAEVVTFDKPAGTYDTTVSVVLSSATANAEIYYTLDGTKPDSSSASTSILYDGNPLEISHSDTIKAVAYPTTDPDMKPSNVTTAIYYIRVLDVEFSEPTGTYIDTVVVELTTPTQGAEIYYTLNGTEPTDSSTLYTAALTITESTTVKAFAHKDGSDPSNITMEDYTIRAGKPVILPTQLSIYDTTAISITSSSVDVTIYYTLNDSEPTTSSNEYTGAFTLSSKDDPYKINAIAVPNAAGRDTSLIGEQDYVVISTSGINTRDISGSLVLIPNPASDKVNIVLNNTETGEIILKVTDISGRAVTIIKENKSGAEFNKEMDLSGLVPGIYQVELNINNKRAVLQLIKE